MPRVALCLTERPDRTPSLLVTRPLPQVNKHLQRGPRPFVTEWLTSAVRAANTAVTLGMNAPTHKVFKLATYLPVRQTIPLHPLPKVKPQQSRIINVVVQENTDVLLQLLQVRSELILQVPYNWVQTLPPTVKQGRKLINMVTGVLGTP